MHLELTRASIANTMTNPLIDDPRIHHVRYTDFVADPIGTIRGYYEFTGRELTAAGRSGDARLPRRQQGRPPRQVRVFDQLLTDIGEDIDALHEEFRPFRERFGVEIENDVRK